MRGHVTRSLLLGILLCASTGSHAAFITDKIVVNLYAQASDQGPVLKKLPSGTSLEIVSTDGQYTRVRTTDGINGWVNSQFITNERPTQLDYLELLGKNKTLEAELKAAREKAAPVPAPATTTPLISDAELADLQQRAKDVAWMRVELKKARDRADELDAQLNAKSKTTAVSQQVLDQLRNENKTLQERLAAALLVNEQQSESITSAPAMEVAPAPSAEPIQTAVPRNDNHWRVKIEWFLGSIMVALIAGAIAGMTWLDNRIRRRHGGFRIY